MFNRINIKNFKSIRDLEFEAKRINLFIGEPNTGKSNLLEALALFSTGVYHPDIFRNIFRFKTPADLFFDQDISKALTIQAGDCTWAIKYSAPSFRGSVFQQGKPAQEIKIGVSGRLESHPECQLGVRYYTFKALSTFANSQPGFLNPPYGDNLTAILYSNKELRQSIGSLFREKGFRLEIKPVQSELLIAKEVHDELYSYQWDSVSETLRRIVFYKAALETNKDAVLLFDEPESNTFPFYTKYLAERIALDETNQFFITTHNPYLLGSIVSKAPAQDVAVFVTYMENFETKVKAITGDGLSEILELSSSVFFNLDKLLAA